MKQITKEQEDKLREKTKQIVNKMNPDSKWQAIFWMRSVYQKLLKKLTNKKKVV